MQFTNKLKIVLYYLPLWRHSRTYNVDDRFRPPWNPMQGRADYGLGISMSRVTTNFLESAGGPDRSHRRKFLNLDNFTLKNWSFFGLYEEILLISGELAAYGTAEGNFEIFRPLSFENWDFSSIFSSLFLSYGLFIYLFFTGFLTTIQYFEKTHLKNAFLAV